MKPTKAERQVFRVADITPAEYNPRTISAKAKAGLEQSLSRYGYLQDVIVNIRNGKNTIVGGHKRLEALGLPAESEIECTIVDLSDQDEKALNITLNNPHISGEFDERLDDIISELKDHPAFNELNLAELISIEKESIYTNKIEAPIYEPDEKEIAIEELCSTSKRDTLILAIKKNDTITEQEKQFLIHAAARHTVFNYENIAQYYSRATPEMQALMEDSALVIIDLEDAIAKGYTMMIDKILDQSAIDYGE